MDRLTTGIAEAIHHFKFHTDPKDMSPPNPSQETMTVRNLAIIDLTNRIGDVIEENGGSKSDFLEKALRSRGTKHEDQRRS